MRRHRRRPGDDAVSPVVGVVLIVGIAVMLMTTVGIFVLGFGPGEQPPEAEVQFHQTGTGGSVDVTITVVDPDNLREGDVRVAVNNSGDCAWTGSGSLQQGESVTISSTDPPPCDVSGGDTVRVTWESSGGGRTFIVGEYEVV